ncbi:PspC domain-containing protein [Leifsonia sp. NPDC058248]|uniref:PspC domain-containing protein n=1 Tax=Leifsonia sp. NPDC058248 TaxID=3346402 RepID=UPI0036D834A3
MSQHESTPPPPPPPPRSGAGTPSSPYGGPQSGFAGRGTRFFDWMRSLGIVRTDGWLGGVCAGLANRLGIDPLIVRGIVVVAAILGAPVLLLYAAAWALLPDRENRIHLQRLFDGDFEPAIVGIGVLALLSLLPLPQGVWWFGVHPWGDPSWGDVVGRVIWTLIVVALVVGLIVLAARNNWGNPASAAAGSPNASPGATAAFTAAASSAPSASGAPTGAAAPSGTVVEDAADDTAGAAPDDGGPASGAASTGTVLVSPSPEAPVLDTSAEPTEPPAPTQGASSQDVADWQARQAAWRAEHAQWKQRLNADMRAVKAQRSAELRVQSAAMQAEATARRRAYRAANPRVGAAIGWLAIGVALIGAALTSALWTPLTGLPGYELTAAFAVATLVFGLTSLIAGLSKRRSGFLTFLGLLLAVITLASAFVPRDRQLVLDGAYLTPVADTNYAQPYGSTTIYLGGDVASTPGTPMVVLDKGTGTTTVELPEDLTVRVVGTLRGGSIFVLGTDGNTKSHHCAADTGGDCTLDVTVGPGSAPDAVVRVHQTGELSIQQDQNQKG